MIIIEKLRIHAISQQSPFLQNTFEGLIIVATNENVATLEGYYIVGPLSDQQQTLLKEHAKDYERILVSEKVQLFHTSLRTWMTMILKKEIPVTASFRYGEYCIINDPKPFRYSDELIKWDLANRTLNNVPITSGNLPKWNITLQEDIVYQAYCDDKQSSTLIAGYLEPKYMIGGTSEGADDLIGVVTISPS